jgi:hypothetical protein
MLEIGQRSFLDGGSRKYIRMSNGEIVRPLPCGSSWTKIRVAFSCAVTPNGTDGVWAYYFTGLCCGPSGVSWPDCRMLYGNHMGLYWSGQNVGPYTYNAGSGNPYVTGPGNYWTSKAGTTGISSAVIGSSTMYFPTTTGTLQRRGIILLEFTRSSSSIDVNSYSDNRSVSNSDCNSADMLEALQCLTVRNTAMSKNNTTNTLYISEATYGYADHFFLYWGNPTFPLEVYEIGMYRVY